MAVSDLIVNKNSYVTLAEAESIITNTYTSDSPELKKWNLLSRDDKIIVLRNSALALNNLRYKGRKMQRRQPLAFPRQYAVIPGIMWTPYISQYYDNSLIDNFNTANVTNI